MTDVITATGLVKHFGTVKALAGLDLAVPQGSVLGLLGPNGAGKTTAVRILTTLLRPDAGQASINGVNVVAQPNKVRTMIGLSGQYAAVDEYLTGMENLEMVGRLYGFRRATARARAGELLERFALDEAANRPCTTYSGGMRRRLDLAAALVASPPVLVLDEPTTGLDPRSRMQMWDVIRELVAGGSTLLLTTQYLEEADRLADTIMVIDHGRCIAQGSADELKQQIGGPRINVTLTHREDVSAASELLAQHSGGPAEISPDNPREVNAAAPEAAQTLLAVVRALDERQIAVSDISLRRPTLDEVFITLTGQAPPEEAAEDTAEETAEDTAAETATPKDEA